MERCSTVEERIAEFIGRNTRDGGDLVGVDAALDFPLFFRLPAVAKGFAPPTEVIEVYRRRKEVSAVGRRRADECTRCAPGARVPTVFGGRRVQGPEAE